MTIVSILVFIAAGLLIRWFKRGRNWLLLGVSVLAVFWLQPAVPVRWMDFWLPVATLALAGLGWFITATPETRVLRENGYAAAVMGGAALLAGLTRFLPEPLLTPSRPPDLPVVIAGLAVVALLAALLYLLARANRAARLPAVMIWALLALFLVLKVPALSAWASAGLRALAGQSTALASAADLRWLGFSYLAFRLIHTARDRQMGRLPAVSLREYVTYAVFFPALTAGPIDRLDRFIKDLRRPFQPCPPDLIPAGQRLALGLFKKFVVADALAMIALNGTNAGQVRSAGWAWVLVYAYAFQIFFDFSGYTDIAIGLGMLLGIKLPENFNAPYLKPNLTQFWNSWHMTLTQWIRAYYFNPVTRWLRSRPKPAPMWSLILFTHVTTMLLIGLWHGVTATFVLWGLWHGLGMFAQNRYSEFMRGRFPPPEEPTPAQERRQKALSVLGTVLTFHYVALGWVFFALPDAGLAFQVLGKLFGA